MGFYDVDDPSWLYGLKVASDTLFLSLSRIPATLPQGFAQSYTVRAPLILLLADCDAADA